jgi:hypothetical protein
MAELNVVFERDCGRYGKIRVTEGTITLGTRTFPRSLLADFDIRRPGWISFDAVRAAIVVFGTLVWILVYVAVVVHVAADADGGRSPGSSFVLVGSMVTVLAICLSGYMLRRSRSLYWFTVRTSSGERYRTRFFGPDPELESVFECLLAGRAPPGTCQTVGRIARGVSERPSGVASDSDKNRPTRRGGGVNLP